jgi:hypothetical protein
LSSAKNPCLKLYRGFVGVGISPGIRPIMDPDLGN